ncbi:MAG TPA: hypothetical protein VNZ03_35440 [Terriglobales bacterium]|nr:hypothetical protein [Terriglobales bacterium]
MIGACVFSFIATGVGTYLARDNARDLKEIKGNVHILAENLENPQIKESMEAGPSGGDNPAGATPNEAGNAKLQVQKVEAVVPRDGTNSPLQLKVFVKNMDGSATQLDIFSNSAVTEFTADREKAKKLIHELAQAEVYIPAYKERGSASREFSLKKGETFWFIQSAPNIGSDMLDGLKQGKYTVYFIGVIGPHGSYCYYVSGDLSKVHECTPESPGFGLGGDFLTKF